MAFHHISLYITKQVVGPSLPPGTPSTREDLPLMSDNQVVDQRSLPITLYRIYLTVDKAPKHQFV